MKNDDIKPELQTVEMYYSTLSKDEYFYIPEFQRAYSWDIEQLDKLWNDIENFDDQKSDNYFIGTIIISMEEDRKLALIDGQQRTTTILLLMKALLIRINYILETFKVDEESKKLFNALKERRKTIIKILYKQEKDDIEEKYLNDYDEKIYKDKNIKIYENESMNEEYKEELNKILAAIDYEEAENETIKIPYKQKDNRYCRVFKNFKYLYFEKINDVSFGIEKLNSFAKKLLERCQLIVIKSWQVDQAINMFNSLNSDGMPLDDADIISSKMYVETDNGKEFKEKWEQLTKESKELSFCNKQGLTPILTQYMYYIRAMRGETKTKTGIDVSTPGLRRYYINENQEIIKNPIKTIDTLLNIVNAWNQVKNYPVIKLLLESNDNAKIYMGGYLYRLIKDYNYGQEFDIDEGNVILIAESLLKLFIILLVVDVGYSSKNFKTFLFEIENDFADKDKDSEYFIHKINKHIKRSWEEADIKERIKTYDRNFLVKIDEYLLAKEKDVKIDFSKCDIEHILPQSGKNTQTIMEDALIDDKDEFKVYSNKLGNKILLETNINRSIGNAWFRQKTNERIEHKKGYVGSQYPNAQFLVDEYKNKLKEETIWTKKEIDKYTEIKATRIVKFIFGD